MDGRDFDQLARAIAGADNRRTFLKRFAAGIGAGVLAAVSGSSTRAAMCRDAGSICVGDNNCCSGTCGPKDRTGRRRCECPAGRVYDGHACVCPDGSFERDGVCVSAQGTCPVGADTCDSPVACNGNSGCLCRQSTEGKTHCSGIAPSGGQLPSCGECATTADCEQLYPGNPGIFCQPGSNGCCNGSAPRGMCYLACP